MSKEELPIPQSRNEEYLNAIATGDFSNLPNEPVSRIERYLACIVENINLSKGVKKVELTLTGGFKVSVKREGNTVYINTFNAATNGQLSGNGSLPKWALPKEKLGCSISASGANFNGVLNITPNGYINYFVATATSEVGVYCGNLVYTVS